MELLYHYTMCCLIVSCWLLEGMYWRKLCCLSLTMMSVTTLRLGHPTNEGFGIINVVLSIKVQR